jgi:acyl carrier protein
MTREIAGETRRIIGEQLHVGDARITPQAFFVEDLGANSLRLLELTIALEEHFDIDISDADAERLRTMQDAVDFIREHFSERNFELPSAS